MKILLWNVDHYQFIILKIYHSLIVIKQETIYEHCLVIFLTLILHCKPLIVEFTAINPAFICP